MFVHVPAMRGRMGSRTYYACLMPLSAIPNLFKFTDWAESTPEDREQRVLNQKRVPDLADYILENEDDYLFASITASYKAEPIFTEIQKDGDSNIGTLKLKLGDDLIINDGQHRCAGIAQAIKQNPALGNHTISVLLFPYESRERVQQMFSDLNRFVVKTSKSLDILYDRRDPISIATMFAVDKIEIFKELMEKEDISLKAKSTKLFTLAAFYDANVELLKGKDEEDSRDNCKNARGVLERSRLQHARLDEGSEGAEKRARTSGREDFRSLHSAPRLRRHRLRIDEGARLEGEACRHQVHRLVEEKQRLGERLYRCQLCRFQPPGARRHQSLHQRSAWYEPDRGRTALGGSGGVETRAEARSLRPFFVGGQREVRKQHHEAAVH